MRGQAEIRILLDGSDIMAVFPADPSSGAWEWFGLQYELNSTYLALGTLTVELQTGGDAGIGYFDDLCVSFSRPCKSSEVHHYLVSVSLSHCVSVGCMSRRVFLALAMRPTIS